MRSKGRFKVYDFYQSNRIEAFNMWLDSGKSWDSLALQIQRTHQIRNRATKGWITIQGKDLKKTHEASKAQHLIEARKKAGLYYPSSDFPEDDDDALIMRWWFPNFVLRYNCVHHNGCIGFVDVCCEPV